MANYDYLAVDASGRQVKGRMSAFSAPEVEASLREDGLWPIEVTERKEAQPLFSGRITIRDKIFTCSRLGYMLGAGVPIVQAIEEIANSSQKPVLKDTLKDILRQIEEGTPLWQAIESHPSLFATLHVNMIRAGEEGGKLAETFLNLSRYIEDQAEFRRQIKQAVSYPIFASVIVFAVLLFYIFYVLPEIVIVLQDLGGTENLLLVSRILLWVGTNPLPSGLIVLSIPAAVFAFLFVTKISARVRLWWDEKKLRLPLIGWPMTCATYARVSQAMGALIASGVPIVEVLELTQGVTGNDYVAQRVAGVRERIGNGETLFEASANENFPPIFASMLKTGEMAGHLEPVLEQLSLYFEADLRYETRRLITYIEPSLLIVMGGVIIVIIVGVLVPIYTTLGSMGQ